MNDAVRSAFRSAAFVACRTAIGATTYRSVILNYHSIGGPGGVPTALFRRQLLFLIKHYRVVPLQDVVCASREPLVCLTFDDGYEDNANTAVPLLDEHGLKATFFLLPGLMGQQLSTSLGTTSFMTWKQAIDVARRGHEIGAHTLTHVRLPRIDAETARIEIRRSKSALEDALGVVVTSFAYPKGEHNHEVREMVGEARFERAVTIREGHLNKPTDPFTLPRVWVGPHAGMTEFKAKLTRALDVYGSIRAVLSR